MSEPAILANLIIADLAHCETQEHVTTLGKIVLERKLDGRISDDDMLRISQAGKARRVDIDGQQKDENAS